jgi:hypothetical protein
MKPQPHEKATRGSYNGIDDEWIFEDPGHVGITIRRCPYGKPGDEVEFKWVPSNVRKGWEHVLSKAMTRTLAEVRVERLQDISSQDAWAEGFRCTCMHPVPMCAGNIKAMRDYWDHLYTDQPEYQWDKNPYVWVLRWDLDNPPLTD